jgi:hypothetical protein
VMYDDRVTVCGLVERELHLPFSCSYTDRQEGHLVSTAHHQLSRPLAVIMERSGLMASKIRDLCH